MTKRSECDICYGNGRVRLPKRAPSVTAFDPSEPPSVADCLWREYACPECSEMAPVEHVQHLKAETEAFDWHMNDPHYVEKVARGTAMSLVDNLLQRGFIRIERSKSSDDYRSRFAVRASMGAVSLKKLDTIEERIAERQTEIAQEVTAEAVRQVDNWNSHHGDNAIRRSDAKYLINESIGTVIKRRLAKWRPMGGAK